MNVFDVPQCRESLVLSTISLVLFFQMLVAYIALLLPGLCSVVIFTWLSLWTEIHRV